MEGLNGCDLLVNFSTTITNAVFDGNKCETKGALAVYNVDDVTVGPNVNFTRNIATVAPSSGGAVGVIGTVSTASWRMNQGQSRVQLALGLTFA